MKNFTYIFILLALVMASCGNKKVDTARLNSSNISKKEDRIQILKKHCKTYSEILDAEYDLLNVNGFNDNNRSVPGASSWDYKFCVRIDSIAIGSWTKGMLLDSMGSKDISWTLNLTKSRQDDWRTISKPKCFVDSSDTRIYLIVYENEGIVFKRILNS